MGKAQRNKGASFERAVANDLTDRLGVVVRRNIGQARDGGDDITVPPFRIECKARKSIAVYGFIDQASAACSAGEVPVVVMKGDRREWLVLMRYTDALPLLQGEIVAGDTPTPPGQIERTTDAHTQSQRGD